MTIGQKIQHQRAMIVIVDTTGQVHAWDVGPGMSSWEWGGVDGRGNSTASIKLDGSLHRRTRDLSKFLNEAQGVIENE